MIPIKLDFSASVGFIHKESVTMHGHTIGKLNVSNQVGVKKFIFHIKNSIYRDDRFTVSRHLMHNNEQ